MFILPRTSRALIRYVSIGRDLRVLPDHDLIKIAVELTNNYRELVCDLRKQDLWAEFKLRISAARMGSGVADFCNRLYENDQYPINAILQLSFFKEFKETFTLELRELGFGDIAEENVLTADPERLRAFSEMMLTGKLKSECDELDRDLDDWDAYQSVCKKFWEEEFPGLPDEEQQAAKQDAGILTGFLLCVFLNCISVMAYRESLSSLVQRALAGGAGADEAFYRAVRVDDNLRRHPAFNARFLRATNEGDSDFLFQYMKTSSPLTNEVRYPGLYFLLGFLDSFGLLDQLSNPKLLDLCDHAKLDRWENRIEDAGYMAKRRSEYLKRRFQEMSMH